MSNRRALVRDGELREWFVRPDGEGFFSVEHYVGGEDTDFVVYEVYATRREAERVADMLNLKEEPETYQWYRDVELSM